MNTATKPAKKQTPAEKTAECRTDRKRPTRWAARKRAELRRVTPGKLRAELQAGADLKALARRYGSLVVSALLAEGTS